MTQEQIRRALESATHISLSRLQLYTLLSEARFREDDGLCEYSVFARIAARTIERMFDPAVLAE